RTQRGQDHRLGIDRIRRLQPTSYVTQAFPDKMRNNFVGVRRVPELVPIDEGMTRLIPNLCLLNVLIIDCHQAAAVVVTDGMLDLNDNQRQLSPPTSRAQGRSARRPKSNGSRSARAMPDA